MPRRIGQPTGGVVAVQQDDGTVVTLPESLAPAPDPVTAPTAEPGPSFPVPPEYEAMRRDFDAARHEALSPVPDNARLDLPSPSESPVPVSASPDLMGAPPPAELAPAAPVSLAPAPADLAQPAMPDALPMPDAITGAAPIVPMTAETAPPPAAAPVYTAEDQAIDAVRTQAAAAANAANAQAAILRRQQADLDDLEADRAEADQRAADHRAGLVAAAEKAANDFATYDVTPDEKVGVGTVIAMIFGGIGNVLARNYTGANPVIAILERKADAAARARQTEQAKLGQLANMRTAAVDNATSWAKDAQAQFSATKAGLLESYAREIESRAAGFAAPAEIAKGEQAAARIREAAAKARAEAADAEHKRQIEEAELSLDTIKTETDRYQAQTARKAIGAQYARIGEDRRQFNIGRDDSIAEKDRRYKLDLAALDLEIEKAAKSGDSQGVAVKREQREAMESDHARSVGVMPQVIKDDKGNVIGAAAKEPLQAPTPKIGPDGKPVLDAKGEPVMEQAVFRATTPVRAKELANKIAAVNKTVAAVDRIIRLREKYGWSSTLMESPEWREMQATYAQGILTKKDLDGLGALTGPDVTIEARSIGTKDPTEMRDPLPGLLESRHNMLQSIRFDMESEGYTGTPFDIPDTSSNAGLKKAASTSPEAALVDEAISASRKGDTFEANSIFGDNPTGPQARYVIEKMAPLATLANSGDAGARAALVRLTRDKILGTDAKLYIVANGIDLGTYASPEELADFRKTYEKADRTFLGNIPNYETPTLGGIKPVKPAKKVTDLKTFGGAR